MSSVRLCVVALEALPQANIFSSSCFGVALKSSESLPQTSNENA